jgi:uncharacterized LabA/DUF88 family protein
VPEPQRLIAYIDGFNPYFGLKSRGWRRYYWLNLRRLVENLLKPRQRLVGVKYFTARIADTPTDPHKTRRQSAYLEALDTVPGLKVFYGHYLLQPRKCRSCGVEDQVPTEKMSDVNIAVEMLGDAYEDRFDTAMLVSADGDLVPPVAAVRRLFPEKPVIVAFPPNRSSFHLRAAASACFTIGRKKLADSQFPDRVTTATGYVVTRPETWR